MTEVQQQMIDKAFELLSEHFDHVVIAVGTYDEDKQVTDDCVVLRRRGARDRAVQALREPLDQGTPLGAGRRAGVGPREMGRKGMMGGRIPFGFGV